MEPCLVFDLDIVEENIIRFINKAKSIFQDKNIYVFYAIKANNNLEVLNCILKDEIGGEVLSESELGLISSDIPIQVNGHYKSTELLEEVINRKKCIINIEDISELYRIKAIYEKRKMNCNINIGIRIKNFKSSRIGFNRNQIIDLVKFINENNWIVLKALHFHAGWNNKNDDDIKEILNNMKKLNDFFIQHEIFMDTWNFGGSFAEHRSYPRQLVYRMKLLQREIPVNITNICFEPGRYLVGDAGYMQSYVVEKRGKQHIINTSTYAYKLSGATPDIRLNRHENHIVEILDLNTEKEESICISGIWPSENDFINVINRDVNIKIGDSITFYNMGAYIDGLYSGLTCEKLLAYNFIGKLTSLFKYITIEERIFFLKYWDRKSKFLQIPQLNKDKERILHILKYLFLEGEEYTENEVNKKLGLYYKDFCFLRREMVNRTILERILKHTMLYQRIK
jgi:diaminopimelate decarboxylase